MSDQNNPPGCIWFSKGVLDCMASATSQAAAVGHDAPAPAHLLLALLQHSATTSVAAKLTQLLTNASMDDVRAVLNTGLLLQAQQGSTLTNPLHDGACLPAATKEVLHAALRLAMCEGKAVVTLRHVLESLCDDLVPSDVNHCPVAFAMYHLLGKDAAQQAVAEFAKDGAALMSRRETCQQRHDARTYDVVAAAPEYLNQTAHALAHVIPHLQSGSDVVQALAFFDEVGVYPNVATRQQLSFRAQHKAPILKTHEWVNYGQEFRLRMLQLLLTDNTTDTHTAQETLTHYARYLPAYDKSPVWPQLLKLLRILRQLRLVAGQEQQLSFAACSQHRVLRTWGVFPDSDLWSHLYKHVQQGVPMYELLDAARCLAPLVSCPEAVAKKLAASISGCADTAASRAAAIQSLISKAGMGSLKLLQDTGDAAQQNPPARQKDVKETQPQDAEGSADSVQSLLQALGRDPNASTQLHYDTYSQLLLQLQSVNLSLAEALGILKSSARMGKPPPSLVPALLEAVISLMECADVTKQGAPHLYLSMMPYHYTLEQQLEQQEHCQVVALDGVDMLEEPAAGQPQVMYLLAKQVLDFFQTRLASEEPTSLLVLGSEVAARLASAGRIARQILKHHHDGQHSLKDLQVFLCMAVPPATITNLQDMAACLVAMHYLTGDRESAMVTSWLNAAKGALVGLLSQWQGDHRRVPGHAPYAAITCLTAWWLLRPAEQLALGEIPYMVLCSQHSDSPCLLWALSAVWGPDMSQPVKPASDHDMWYLTAQLSTVQTSCGLLQMTAGACQLHNLTRAAYQNPFLEQLSDAAIEALFKHMSDHRGATKLLRQLDAEQLQQLSSLVLQLLPPTTAPPAAAAVASAAEQRVAAALLVLLNEMEARMHGGDAGKNSTKTSSSPQQGSSTAAEANRSPPADNHQQWRAVMTAIQSRLRGMVWLK